MTRERRNSLEELGRKGREIYRQRTKPQLGKGLHGKIVALDIDTGEFEIADKPLEAADRLLARLPDAQIWCERVGYGAVHQFGQRLRAG